MFKKLATEASPNKQIKIGDTTSPPKSDIPQRKPSLNYPYDRHPFRIFDSVDNIYGIVHSPNKLQP